MKFISTAIAILLLSHTKSLNAQDHNVKAIEWKKIGVLPPSNGHLLGFAGPVAGVSNGVFIVGGGANFPDSMPWLGGKKKYYEGLFVYQKSKNDSLVLFRSFRLPFPLGYAACVSTKKGIVVAGGENSEGITNQVLLIEWDSATREIITKYLPHLPYRVSSAGATVCNGILYIAGGDMGAETSDHFLSLDLNSTDAEWKELPPLPNPTSHSVFVCMEDNKALYLIGGRKKNMGKPSTLYKDVYAYDVKRGNWEKKRPLPYALSAGTGASVEGNIVLFGGDAGETFHKTEKLILAIEREQDENKKRQLMMEKIKLQSGHPGFCGSELVYGVHENKWKQIGCIPFDAPVTTTAVSSNGEVIIAGGEIRAGVRTPHILSAKIIMK